VRAGHTVAGAWQSHSGAVSTGLKKRPDTLARRMAEGESRYSDLEGNLSLQVETCTRIEVGKLCWLSGRESLISDMDPVKRKMTRLYPPFETAVQAKEKDRECDLEGEGRREAALMTS
jgi:hypothetical protein